MILLIGGQKGGAGKTNITTNLAAYLVGKAIDLIVIDTDRSQNSSAKWAARRREVSNAKQVQCVLAHEDIREVVQDLNKRYDLVLIDAGGRDSKEFRTSLAVANVCLTPFVPSQHDVDTLPLVNDLIEQIKVFNPELTGYAVFSNCPQNKSAREKRINEYREVLKEELTELTLLKTEIINRIAYTDTATNGLGVTEMNDEKASSEIESLYREIF